MIWLSFVGLNYDSTISLGNIFLAGMFLVGALLRYHDTGWKVKNLENWRDEHRKECVDWNKQRDLDNKLNTAILLEMKLMITKLDGIYLNMNDRLKLLEDELREWRSRRRV